jgi:stage II sporulation SpoAA-like protein
MAVEFQEKADGKVLEVRASGKLTKEDYERFLPEVERLIGQHGKVRMLFEMHDFHGWTAGALWHDIKFDMKHFRDIERLAVVGEKRWEHGMAIFCRPFTTAKIRYFDRSRADEADAWIQADLPVVQPSGSGAA